MVPLPQRLNIKQNSFGSFSATKDSDLNNVFFDSEDQDDVPKDDIEKLYKEAGCGSPNDNMGRYQKIALTLMMMTMNSGGLFYYGIPLYEKIPTYKCTYAGEEGYDFWRPCNVT